MRIILGCSQPAKIIIQREELGIPSVQSRITLISTMLGVRILQLEPAPPITLALREQLTKRNSINRRRQAPLSPNQNWVTRTAQRILSFSVWNTDPLNIPKCKLSAPWHRTHVRVTIQTTQTSKAHSSSNILKAEFTDHITRVLNPRNEIPPVAIYCDASVNLAGAAGIGVLIPSLGRR